jgi:hypothetical protein
VIANEGRLHQYRPQRFQAGEVVPRRQCLEGVDE